MSKRSSLERDRQRRRRALGRAQKHAAKLLEQPAWWLEYMAKALERPFDLGDCLDPFDASNFLAAGDPTSRAGGALVNGYHLVWAPANRVGIDPPPLSALAEPPCSPHILRTGESSVDST